MDIKKIINNFVDAHADEIEKAIRSALAEEKPINKIKAGDHFEYKGIEWVCLETGNDAGNKTAFAVSAKIIAYMPFNDECKNGCNDWRTSSLRKWLNGDFLNKKLDKNALLLQHPVLTADNGDEQYGVTGDYVTLLSCDQYRKYRKFMPKYDNWVWTLTPCSCDAGSSHYVRVVNPSGGLNDNYAFNPISVVPVCLFNLDYLISCGQAHIISNPKEVTTHD